MALLRNTALSVSVLLLVVSCLPFPVAADCTPERNPHLFCIKGPAGELNKCQVWGTGTAAKSSECGKCVKGHAYSVSATVKKSSPDNGVSVVLHCSQDGVPSAIADCGAITEEGSTTADCGPLTDASAMGIVTFDGTASCDVTPVGDDADQEWVGTCSE